MARTAAIAAVVLAALGCHDTGGGVEAVEALPRGVADAPAQQPPALAEAPEAPETLRRSAEGPESILEFGLFGPVVPALADEVYEGDCHFENDPYETCL